ncbi:LysE family translocator [Aquimarina sediminis]|uniref:LysE family translocator n=1 Tax=Aquimarina sediminis TaxID=2070536 RepID=UPI000CA08C43|nr:LysE family translocator [Aquimarina sediminis]
MILPDFESIMFFLAAASVLILIPGPSVLYIMARSMEQGYKAGIVSVLGIGVGSLIHVSAAAIGISSILLASSTAFSIIKYLGAIYLIYLGVKKLLEKTPTTQPAKAQKRKQLNKIFYEAIVVNTFNPKTAIFFFSFLPQFINVEKGGNAGQILFLGILFTVFAVLSDTLYVLLSMKISKWFANSKKYLRRQKNVTGSIYIALGLLTLTMNQPSNTK